MQTFRPRGILFDLDGVLYVGKEALPGAHEAVKLIRASGMPCRFVTNTSTLSQVALAAKVRALGFDIQDSEIFSAPQAAIHHLRSLGSPVCQLLLAEDVRRDFAEFRLSDENAEVIVIGDIGEAWTYALLNQLFNRLMQGARLVAIHKNRFWQTERGLQLDIGAFVHGLEYASGTQALLLGKPAPAFFEMALEDMGIAAADALMVGDDIDVDVAGAQGAGLKGVLVKTGKYRRQYVESTGIQPDAILESVADLPRFLNMI